MSMRSYSGLVLLETLFDSVPSTNPDLNNFVSALFTPHVEIVEEDCETGLGDITTVNYELEGKIELATGLPISKDRIEQLLSHGIYTVAVRNLSTCISKGGVCLACYLASRPYESVIPVGNLVQIFPEYVTSSETHSVIAGDSRFTLSETPDLYDYLYVYYEGSLLAKNLYTVTDTTLVLNSALPRDGQLTTRYTTVTRAPFLAWLADTYSGSLLGLKALPSPRLPIRKRLLTSLVPLSMLELLIGQVSTLKAVPAEAVSYLSNIKDPLEKSLFVVALFSIYLNVL